MSVGIECEDSFSGRVVLVVAAVDEAVAGGHTFGMTQGVADRDKYVGAH